MHQISLPKDVLFIQQAFRMVFSLSLDGLRGPLACMGFQTFLAYLVAVAVTPLLLVLAMLLAYLASELIQNSKHAYQPQIARATSPITGNNSSFDDSLRESPRESGQLSRKEMQSIAGRRPGTTLDNSVSFGQRLSSAFTSAWLRALPCDGERDGRAGRVG